jgi:hypothetical protein
MTTKQLVAKAEAILGTADAEGRHVTAAEKQAVSDLIDKAELTKSVETLWNSLASPWMASRGTRSATSSSRATSTRRSSPRACRVTTRRPGSSSTPPPAIRS